MSVRRTVLGANGRIVIPATCRRALGLRSGMELILVEEEGELRLIPLARAIKRAQELVCRRIPKRRNLSRELLAERRHEARRE